LERGDNKQAKISEFVQSFNRFSEEFPELRSDDQTKEELHNRVENLSNNLWNVIEEKKDEALNECHKIMTGGWIEQE
jgi:hypothetical protein